MSAPVHTPAPSAAPLEPDAPTRFEVGGLVYQLDRPPRPNGRRSVVVVRLAEHPEDHGFRDRVDLFAFKSRTAFAGRVADAFGRQTGEIMGQLALILDATERAQAQEPHTQPEDLTSERRAAAEALLDQPDLLGQAAAAMEALGYVGEPEVKRLCYLVATSRLLSKPLNALLLAPSGAGKSAVLDVVSALMPPEQVEPLARLTANALYYMGPHALTHKLVVVDEYEGAGEADHPLRVLQSKGELRLSLTVKGRAECFTVRGPVAVMSGSTATNLDLQNTSRCLELSLDDSPEQTRRIQAAQCAASAGVADAGPDVLRWQDAQRLLEPLRYRIPFATKLRFPARTTADRRGSTKLLGLIGAHALLHQRLRERDEQGQVIAAVTDYAAVHALLAPTIARDLDGLSPRAARAYRLLQDHDVPLARRTVASEIGWSYNTSKKALAELVDQELVVVADPGPPARYRVLARSVLGSGGALVPPADLA